MPPRTEPPTLQAAEKHLNPLSSFTRLSQVVRLYTPNAEIVSAPTSPTTILFCSWMNASAKHTAYYTRTYQRLFPGARIILCTINTSQFLLTTETTRRAQVKEAITALLAGEQENERLLVHVLSNGGAKRFYGISREYREMTGKPLPMKGFVVDSAPGIPQFRRDIHALAVPARNWTWYLKAPYMTSVFLVTCVVYVTVNWMPRSFWHELVWGPHDGAHNHQLVEPNVVKGFVYSKEDQAIDWRNVEAHADDTEKAGYKVLRKRVEGAVHVQLFRGKGGEDDYWGFVQRVWGVGLGIES
ncbi:hypothetical protein BJ875DRAFT_105331 [Amylocarpus encephaloides]|uniref:Indole-diterpene biosynthesis protein PaxU n=1 Tax=Amylocarpus encephaloides TaxID=45428 RepID=A0A9P7YEN3_9HELO|nr:hypothetical protein BJ875DRAFT_105331 [Amylocarpus encephaloides]